jgi:small subunit ribosomal protein S6
MKNYDGLFILNIQGKDEGLKEAIESIEKEIEGFGGKINGTQKMDRKRFERMAGDLDSGFYVNVQFSLAPDKVEPLRAKLTLNEIVYRQFYLKQETVAA